MQSYHYRDEACAGKVCGLCKAPATHRLSQQVHWADYRWSRPERVVFLCCDCMSRASETTALCSVDLDEPPDAENCDFELIDLNQNAVEFGEWTLYRDRRQLIHRYTGFDLDLGKSCDAHEIVSWFGYLLEKGWVTSDTLSDLLIAFDAIFDIAHIRSGPPIRPIRKSIKLIG